ncbi:uncharacterized protein LAJ45_04335 [Morchella importuna]|uniref:Prenylcysteine oxidase n=1 Tax=Morchella conica CCBAS932 TaxID=1392247 RepID=A0A3N4KDM6_9PEZI|nr:uncharacterized protein LAJ45_04335 [Morchella importuna]KAH8151713.1 hypothetical protein LAJ45_04335 [Morchella importuna]RPB08623.1 Prenylcysteine oxidase [Morchella conica CCBAS932]
MVQSRAGVVLATFTLASLTLFFYAFASSSPEAHNYHEQQPLGNEELSWQHTKRVAIIGAGSGGSSAAYYLRKYAGTQPVNITIFDTKNYIGGRSTTVNVYNDPTEPVELGASIFVSVNYNLMNAVEEFGLDISGFTEDRPGEENVDPLAVWDGSKFAFRQAYTEGKLQDWWSLAKLLWKYGPTAPMRTKKLMSSTVGKFLNMYEAPLFPFSSLSTVVEEAGLLEATSDTGEQYLVKNGINGKFPTDLIQASTRVNYGQNLGLIHGLETMVCMATDGAVSVRGGNWRIFSGMVDASKAEVRLGTRVSSVTRDPNGPNPKTWVLSSHGPSGEVVEEEYDDVILASPYQFSELTISPELKKTPDEIPYVTLHVTLFTSPNKLDPEFFGLPVGDRVPEAILTTLNETEQASERFTRGTSSDAVGSVGFFSISTLRSTVNFNLDPGSPSTDENTRKGRYEYLYKVFSPKEFTDAQLYEILGAKTAEEAKISWSYRKIWQAYPYLYPRVTFEDPIMDTGLWYTSGIESFISTMETSSLMGMNVAKLIANEWEKEAELKMKYHNENGL